jgi:hypothetical protein
MSPPRPTEEPAGDGGEPDGGKTNPNLLDRVRGWGDHPAKAEFYDQYNPMLRR